MTEIERWGNMSEEWNGEVKVYLPSNESDFVLIKGILPGTDWNFKKQKPCLKVEVAEQGDDPHRQTAEELKLRDDAVKKMFFLAGEKNPSESRDDREIEFSFPDAGGAIYLFFDPSAVSDLNVHKAVHQGYLSRVVAKLQVKGLPDPRYLKVALRIFPGPLDPSAITISIKPGCELEARGGRDSTEVPEYGYPGRIPDETMIAIAEVTVAYDPLLFFSLPLTGKLSIQLLNEERTKIPGVVFPKNLDRSLRDKPDYIELPEVDVDCVYTGNVRRFFFFSRVTQDLEKKGTMITNPESGKKDTYRFTGQLMIPGGYGDGKKHDISSVPFKIHADEQCQTILVKTFAQAGGDDNSPHYPRQDYLKLVGGHRGSVPEAILPLVSCYMPIDGNQQMVDRLLLADIRLYLIGRHTSGLKLDIKPEFSLKDTINDRDLTRALECDFCCPSDAGSIVFDTSRREAAIKIFLKLDASNFINAKSGDAIQTSALFELWIAEEKRGSKEPLTSFQVKRRVKIEFSSSRNFVSIDLGVSSIAVAISAEGQDPETIYLGSILADIDKSHSEMPVHLDRNNPNASDMVPFIASYIGLSKEKEWRTKGAPESLFGYFCDGPLLPLPEDVAERLGRHYVVSVPFAPAAHLWNPTHPVIYAPKMALMKENEINLEGRVERVPRFNKPDKENWSPSEALRQTVNIERMVADVLHELADFYLMRSQSPESLFGAHIVLTYPNRYSDSHKRKLKDCSAGLCQRLGTPHEHGLHLISESDAAAYHLLKHSDLTANANTRVLVFDLGAGTLDLSVLQPEVPPNPNQRPSWAHCRVLNRSGASIGGNAIDFVLYFVIDAVLKRLERISDGRFSYRTKLVLKNQKEFDHEEGTTRKARRNLADEIHRAKVTLTKDCQEKTQNKDYCWPNDIKLRVKVGKTEGALGEEDWPLVCGRESDDAVLTVASGIEVLLKQTAEEGSSAKDIFLEFDKSAVEKTPIKSLMEFMASLMIEKSVVIKKSETDNTIEPFGCGENDWVLLSGRGVMWPLIWEKLKNTLSRTKAKLVHRQPGSPSELKKAVALGAIAYARTHRESRPAETPPELAVLMIDPESRTFHSGEPELIKFSGLECEESSETGERRQRVKDYNLRGRLSLVELPQGIEVSDLKVPWAEYMISTIYNLGNATDYSSRGSDNSSLVLITKDGKFKDIEGCPTRSGGGDVSQAQSLFEKRFRVTHDQAPPDWEGFLKFLNEPSAP